MSRVLSRAATAPWFPFILLGLSAAPALVYLLEVRAIVPRTGLVSLQQGRRSAIN